MDDDSVLPSSEDEEASWIRRHRAAAEKHGIPPATLHSRWRHMNGSMATNRDGLELRGASIDDLAKAIIEAALRYHKCPFDSAPSFPGIVSHSLNSLLSFFSPLYSHTFTIDKAGHAETSGRGLELAVWHRVFERITTGPDSEVFWVKHFGYYVPKFSTLPTAPPYERSRIWNAYGFLCGLFIFYYGRPPPTISPFIIFVLLGEPSAGKASFSRLTHEFILALDWEIARRLEPWFALKPTDPLPYAKDASQRLLELLLSTGAEVRAATSQTYLSNDLYLRSTRLSSMKEPRTRKAIVSGMTGS